MKTEKNLRIRRMAALILLGTLAASAVFCAARLIWPPEVQEGALIVRTRSDYLLMFMQCLLGMAVMALPSLASRKWKLELPTVIHVMYYAFLYCAVFLGEVFSFYYLIPHWDTILHSFSGAMLAALGFILVDFLNRDEHVHVSLSPAFVALFAFCFALAAGGVWEIYEYVADGMMGLNMQKFADAQGVVMSGRDALRDTMDDMIVDASAAAVTAVIGYLSQRKRRKTSPAPSAK